MEEVKVTRCQQCGKHLEEDEETWSCSDGTNESLRVCESCKGEL